jgi:hypothetical protein
MRAGSAPIARILTIRFTKPWSAPATIGGDEVKDFASERFSNRAVSPHFRAAGERAHG